MLLLISLDVVLLPIYPALKGKNMFIAEALFVMVLSLSNLLGVAGDVPINKTQYYVSTKVDGVTLGANINVSSDTLSMELEASQVLQESLSVESVTRWKLVGSEVIALQRSGEYETLLVRGEGFWSDNNKTLSGASLGKYELSCWWSTYFGRCAKVEVKFFTYSEGTQPSITDTLGAPVIKPVMVTITADLVPDFAKG